MKNLKRVKNIYLTLTVCFIVGGLMLLFWPGLGLDVLCKICGAFLLIYGLAKISSYFTKDIFQLAFQFDFGLGVVLIILGSVMIFRTEHIVGFLAFCIGIFLLVDAALKIQTAIEAKRFGIERWKWILFTAIVAGVIGALLLFNPFKATNIIVRMVGLGICLDGLMNLVVVINTVRTVKSSSIEIID